MLDLTLVKTVHTKHAEQKLREEIAERNYRARVYSQEVEDKILTKIGITSLIALYIIACFIGI